MRRHSVLAWIGTTLLALSGPSWAQVQTPSGGEQTETFVCPFECKPGPVVQGTPTWEAVTTLMLVNMDDVNLNTMNLVYVDGNQKILGASRNNGTSLGLSGEDLDEINVCRTLQAAGITVPQAGIVEIFVVAGPFSSYAWSKTLLGKFFVNVDEPFAGRVTGISKTACRNVPRSVITATEIIDKVNDSGAPLDVPFILVEGTADPEPTPP